MFIDVGTEKRRIVYSHLFSPAVTLTFIFETFYPIGETLLNVVRVLFPTLSYARILCGGRDHFYLSLFGSYLFFFLSSSVDPGYNRPTRYE